MDPGEIGDSGVGELKLALPRVGSRKVRRRGTRVTHPTYRHQTIMLVDDEPAIVDTTRKMLERAGYYVVPYTSGRDAVAFCRVQHEQVDLLLTDIEMPRMNGVELARSIADYKPGIPVLFMTAYDTQADTLVWPRKHLEGASVVNKPLCAGVLIERIEEMISRSLVKTVGGFT